MRRYQRVIFVWLLIIASLIWGLPIAWQQILSEFQQYKKLTVHGREESVKSSLVYQLQTDKWVAFSIPENTEKVRLISNLNIKPLAIPPATQTELEQRWQYILHYQLLDRQNRVLVEQRYHHGTRLTRYQNEQGQQFNTNHYNNDLVALDGRLAMLSLKPFPSAVKIQLKLETFEPQAVDAVIRVYVPAKVAEHRIGTLWLRMNDKQKQTLAKGSVYPANLLSETEKLNLLRHQWSPLGPQGIVDRDYQMRTLYVMHDVGYEEVTKQILSTGLMSDAQHPAVIPIPEQGGRLFLELKPVESKMLDEAVIKLRWFGRGLKQRWQRDIVWQVSNNQIELPVSGGLLELSSIESLSVRAFMQQDGAKEKQEITPQLSSVLSYYADQGLNYKIRHVDEQPTAIRIDVRQIISTTSAFQPLAVNYQWLDAEQQILEQGQLDTVALMQPSRYDRLKNAEQGGQISDPQRYYFKAPNAAKYLHITAQQAGALVSLYNQPNALVKQQRVPEHSYTSLEEQETWSPGWFIVKPVNDKLIKLRQGYQVIKVQPRPPEDDPYLVKGLYLWEDYLPNGKARSNSILSPYEGKLNRDESLASVYCELPTKQAFQARLKGYGHRRVLTPELIFMRSDTQAFDFNLMQNQHKLVQSTAMGRQGVYYLPQINTGRQILQLNSSATAKWVMNYIADCPKEYFLKRRVFQLNQNNNLVFDVDHKSMSNETLSAKIYTKPHGHKRSQIKVTITPVTKKTSASYKSNNDWTFTQRSYDIRHSQMPVSWMLFTNGRRLNAGESFFIPMNSDLAAGRYRIEISLVDGEPGFVALSKLSPGLHPQRHFYNEGVINGQ